MTRRSSPAIPCCPPKAPLARRRLVAGRAARDLAGVFKILSDETRLGLLHALCRAGELSVTDLCRAVGMKPQAVSNQLRRLAGRGILGARRDGTRILYRIVDPCVPDLLDRGWCLADDARTRRRRR